MFGELMSTVKNKCALEYLNYFQTELDFWVTLKYINIKVLLEPLFCPFENFAPSRGSETQGITRVFYCRISRILYMPIPNFKLG